MAKKNKDSEYKEIIEEYFENKLKLKKTFNEKYSKKHLQYYNTGLEGDRENSVINYIFTNGVIFYKIYNAVKSICISKGQNVSGLKRKKYDEHFLSAFREHVVQVFDENFNHYYKIMLDNRIRSEKSNEFTKVIISPYGIVREATIDEDIDGTDLFLLKKDGSLKRIQVKTSWILRIEGDNIIYGKNFSNIKDNVDILVFFKIEEDNKKGFIFTHCIMIEKEGLCFDTSEEGCIKMRELEKKGMKAYGKDDMIEIENKLLKSKNLKEEWLGGADLF